MKNIPKAIYLQIGEDCDAKDFTEVLFDNNITWASNKINENDIRYVIDKRHINKKVKGIK